MDYTKTLDFINSKINDFKPDIGIVLGSGLGCFCEGMDGIRLDYIKIPNFLKANVSGHKGELLFTKIAGKNIVIMQGRFHYYEGYTLKQVTFPILIFKLLGVRTLFLTNAAGAVSKDFNIGDIMLISDHINFMGVNPLIGKNDEKLGERFPDMSNCYNENLRILAQKAAHELNIEIKQGIYLATSGPNYETKAEVNMFKLLGADAVGMSTVPEAIAANYLKIKTVAFSTITNYATGVYDGALSHFEVLKTGKTTGYKLNLLIKKMIEKMD